MDLTDCEREPICHLGLIQPHGFMLAIEPDGTVTHASENTGQHLALAARDALGCALKQVLGATAERILRDLAGIREARTVRYISDSGIAGFSLWVHRRGSKYVLEWEQASATDAEARLALKKSLLEGLPQIGRYPHILRQAQVAAEMAARLTGFDRVMVYQFHPDWTGEVIAEVRQAHAEPYLGLRYPASDIPPQARRLYTENLLRVLVDVAGTPVNVLARPEEKEPLDLTMSQLRAMSPYHVEYLKNMKVGATATVSLMYRGALWGLIACHHERRKPVTPLQREALTEIAEALSSSIEGASGKAALLAAQRLRARLRALEAAITDRSMALSTVLFGPERLRNLVRGCGTAVWNPDVQLRMGDAPALPELERYAARVLEQEEDLVAVHSRSDWAQLLGPVPHNLKLAGAVAIVVSRKPALVLFGFRLETINEITWGGDINQPVLKNEETGALSPRRSFSQYKQSIAGTATPWTDEDVDNARMVKDVIRGKAPGPAEMSEVIESGFEQIASLATSEDPLHDSLLDAIGNGIFLLFRSDCGAPLLRYANSSLLDLAAVYSEDGAIAPNARDLLENIGLPLDLLTESGVTPRQVKIPTACEGLHDYMVERKLALEVASGKGVISLSALLFTDITRSERAREALQAAQKKAEDLAQLKSSFLANMSHEIRTPMNGILGMVQMLQGTHKDAEQQHYLDLVQQSGDVMLNVINDILDFSQIDSGHVELEHSPFDMKALLDGLVELMQPRAREKSIDVGVIYDSQPGWYLGDSLRLKQLLLNIVGNAVKFTAKGGVTVRVQSETKSASSELVVIAISDTGIGIPEDQLPHIFEKFHQADQSTTRQHGGTGLGLAIARQLAILMSGNISLTSAVGVGSTFTISIPFAPCEERAGTAVSQVELPAKRQASGKGGGRVLVAEDDLTNQIVIQAMLGKKGYSVEIARTGAQAVGLFEEHGCDLILMDCHMPEMDGYQATRRIRTMEGGSRHTPIIALTANALPEDRQRCLDSGMDDFVAKPIQLMELVAALQKWNCLANDDAPEPVAGKK